MKRREFLKTSATAALGAGALASCAAPSDEGPAVHTQRNVQWRIVSSFPRGLDTIYGGAEVLAERVEALSEGRFKIRPYAAGEIVPGLQVLDAVQQGTVQAGHTASYYFTGKTQSLAFDTAMPFGMTTRQQAAWLNQGGGLELMQGVFSDFNIISFPAGSTGAQMGGWFKREVDTPADLEGLRMRIPGLGGQVMDRLGVTVQVLAGGDIYPALERGAIDATEWVGPYDDEKLGFHQIAKYYYYPGWWEPGPNLSALVNRAAWDELPATYQEIFRSAAAESYQTMLNRYDARNPAALQRLIESGTELRPFSPEILDACRNASEELMQEHAAADAAYAEIFEHWKKFKEDSFRWFGTTEQHFANYSFG